MLAFRICGGIWLFCTETVPLEFVSELRARADRHIDLSSNQVDYYVHSIIFCSSSPHLSSASYYSPTLSDH